MEWANQTLQDRLLKEMRLRGIDDMAAGNAYLPEFMADFNGRFAVAPRNPADAHRAVLHDAAELDLILCEHHARKLTKNLTIGFQSREYQVMGRGKGYRLRGAEVTVCKAFDGSVTVLRDGRELPVRLLAAGRGGGTGGRRKDCCSTRGPGQGRAAVAAEVQAAAGPSLAPAVQAGGGGDGGWMRTARRGAPAPWASVATLPTPKGRTIAGTACGFPASSPALRSGQDARNAEGTFLLCVEKGTFLLCVDIAGGAVHISEFSD